MSRPQSSGNREQDNNRSPNPTSPPQRSHQQAHSASSTEAEMAQAFRDLARGEQQATAIEANLATLESKLDALLASIEAGTPAAKTDGDKDKASEERQSPEKQ